MPENYTQELIAKKSRLKKELDVLDEKLHQARHRLDTKINSISAGISELSAAELEKLLEKVPKLKLPPQGLKAFTSTHRYWFWIFKNPTYKSKLRDVRSLVFRTLKSTRGLLQEDLDVQTIQSEFSKKSNEYSKINDILKKATRTTEKPLRLKKDTNFSKETVQGQAPSRDTSALQSQWEPIASENFMANDDFVSLGITGHRVSQNECDVRRDSVEDVRTNTSDYSCNAPDTSTSAQDTNNSFGE